MKIKLFHLRNFARIEISTLFYYQQFPLLLWLKQTISIAFFMVTAWMTTNTRKLSTIPRRRKARSRVCFQALSQPRHRSQSLQSEASFNFSLLSPRFSKNLCNFTQNQLSSSWKSDQIALPPPNLSHASVDLYGTAASAIASSSAATPSSSSPRKQVSSSDVASARADKFDYCGPQNNGDSVELIDAFSFSVDVRRVFLTVFGLKEFRTNQLQAINAALLDFDTFVTVPTGLVSFVFRILDIFITSSDNS